MVTGLGLVVPAPLSDAVAGRVSAPPEATPEITAFEVPESTPAWGFEVLDFSIEKELPNVKGFVDRTSALALGATKAALADAGLLNAEQRPANLEIGCAYGTTLGCLEAMTIFWNKVKTSNPKFAQPLPFTHGYANSPSSLMCIEFGLRGPAATFSGTRLSGIEALLFAVDQIAAGSGDIIVAGASDSLTAAGLGHLQATGQLSRSGNWDDGIVPGEGAAMLVLESDESARKRGAKIYAEIEGVNFFPLDPKAIAAPIQIATEKRETLVFASTPNLHPGGGWASPLWADMPSVAAKLYSGDMLSASPLAGAALAAGTLGGRYPRSGACALPLLKNSGELIQVHYSVVTGYDPDGSSGIVWLKKAGL